MKPYYKADGLETLAARRAKVLDSRRCLRWSGIVLVAGWDAPSQFNGICATAAYLYRRSCCAITIFIYIYIYIHVSTTTAI
jgi:hypothetical protein